MDLDLVTTLQEQDEKRKKLTKCEYGDTIGVIIAMKRMPFVNYFDWITDRNGY